MMGGGRSDPDIPPMLLVRLWPRLPNGEVVGESRRVCHLVPVPNVVDVPEVLRAYCGQQIAPGTAERLNRVCGMPCEPCLARSPVPAFAMLRGLLPLGLADPSADFGGSAAMLRSGGILG
jgi:hypothetical protein